MLSNETILPLKAVTARYDKRQHQCLFPNQSSLNWYPVSSIMVVPKMHRKCLFDTVLFLLARSKQLKKIAIFVL